MASKRKTKEVEQATPELVAGDAYIYENEYVQNLMPRVDHVFNACRAVILERARQGYGDALSPTGGYMNVYAMIERKMDRLRNKVWVTGLSNEVPNDPIDTIEDMINYLVFLELVYEDEILVGGE